MSTDPAVRTAVAHRLITIEKSVQQLESIGLLDTDRLEYDPAIGMVTERILALLDGLAAAINRDVAVAQLGELPGSWPSSFDAAARAGLIDAELAARLAVPDGTHVRLQLCMDLEPERVAGVVSDAAVGYRNYLTQVRRWVTDQAGGG